MLPAGSQPKQLLLCSAPTAVPYLPRRLIFFSDGPSSSNASSTVPPPSPTPPSSVYLKWRPKLTWISYPLFTKPSGSRSGSAAGKRSDQTRSLLRSPSMVALNS
ncbi:hypothetical protein SprV_0100109700 [Sparganum proliferum]